MINLKNLSVVLTGATGGIGNSILKKLVEQGANVLATGTNDDKLKNIKDKFPSVKVEKFDISKHDEIENFIDKSYQILGNKIDVLINNAAITLSDTTLKYTLSNWNKTFQINLNACFYMSQLSAKNMVMF